MSGTGFINAMQWWNDELQTSHLRQIEQTLNSNLSSLRWAQQQNHLNQQAQQQKIEAAKNSIFSARKFLEEAEEQISRKQPSNALFLFIRVMEVMHEVNDTDFSDLSDKEYYLTVSKKYNQMAKKLEESFGREYIHHLRNLKKTRHLYLLLINIQFFKQVIGICQSGNHRTFFGNMNAKRIKNDILTLGQEKNRTELANNLCKQLDKKGYSRWILEIKEAKDDLIKSSCELDTYGLVEPELLDACDPSNMHVFIDPLSIISKELQENGQKYLGIGFNSFDNYVYG